MVKDNIRNAGLYAGISPRVARALEFIRAGGLNGLSDGRHDIDGDDLYVTVQTNPLKPWAEGKWEAHRAYADIQYVFAGHEVIGHADTVLLPSDETYDSARDIEFLADAPGTPMLMNEGDFALLYPGDAHRPNMLAPDQQPGDSVGVAVFKVRL